MSGQEKTRTVYIRECHEAYIEAEVKVTEETYAKLQKASEEGDTKTFLDWNTEVQTDQEFDLDWNSAGEDFDSSELSSILDEEGDCLWYAQYIPPLVETPAAPAAGQKDVQIVIVRDHVRLLEIALDGYAKLTKDDEIASILREYATVIAEAAEEQS